MVSASIQSNGNSVKVEAQASDNIGVEGVTLILDGSPIPASLVNHPSAGVYSLNYRLNYFSLGDHTLTAEARDAAGNVGKSGTSHWVLTADDLAATLPTVKAAASGNFGLITLSAVGTDAVGMGSVHLYVDGASLKDCRREKAGTLDLECKALFDALSLSDGQHILKTEAMDDGGNLKTVETPFTVSSAAGYVEKEPNNERALANVVASDQTQVAGTVRLPGSSGSTDVDYFRLTLAANEKLTLDLFHANPDTLLIFTDAQGASLASGTQVDANTRRISYANGAAPQDVYVLVGSTRGAFTSPVDASYRLSIARQ